MTNEERKVFELALEALENNIQTHHYCEDTWYSCPKHEDGCANELEGDECNCGADEINAQFDKAITAIKELLAQPVVNQSLTTEPVAWESILGAVGRGWCYEENANKTIDSDLAVAIAKEVQALYTTPPHRKPLTCFDTEKLAKQCGVEWTTRIDKLCKLAIEAAHGIKE